MKSKKTVLKLLVAVSLLLSVGLATTAAEDMYIGCEGWYHDQCYLVADPQLLSLELRVNGVATDFPANVSAGDHVEFVFEYLHPHCNMPYGYPFIVVDGEPICLSEQQFTSLFCSSADDGPATVEIDPSFFLNGDGAPYGFEISDTCGHHSNRLPVELLTDDDEADDDDDDNEKSGCGCW